MARWKLLSAHYLDCEGSEWEQVEQVLRGNKAGQMLRKRFKVPRFLHPEDPSDWTHTTSEGGEVIVCYEGKGEPRDVVFEGEPTPEMEPLDNEAREISGRLQRRISPMGAEAFPAQGEMLFSERLVQDFTKQIEAIVRGAAQGPLPNTPVDGIDPAAFTALQKQVAELLEMNRMLAEQLKAGQEPLPPLEDLPSEEPAQAGRRA